MYRSFSRKFHHQHIYRNNYSIIFIHTLTTEKSLQTNEIKIWQKLLKFWHTENEFLFLARLNRINCIKHSPATLELTVNPEMFHNRRNFLNIIPNNQTENHSKWVRVTFEILKLITHGKNTFLPNLNGIQLQHFCCNCKLLQYLLQFLKFNLVVIFSPFNNGINYPDVLYTQH